MIKRLSSYLSKHPRDKVVHFILCLVPVLALPHLVMVASVLFFSIMLEYEQKAQVWYNDLPWNEYIKKHSLGDLISDILGIVTALIINKVFI